MKSRWRKCKEAHPSWVKTVLPLGARAPTPPSVGLLATSLLILQLQCAPNQAAFNTTGHECHCRGFEFDSPFALLLLSGEGENQSWRCQGQRQRKTQLSNALSIFRRLVVTTFWYHLTATLKIDFGRTFSERKKLIYCFFFCCRDLVENTLKIKYFVWQYKAEILWIRKLDKIELLFFSKVWLLVISFQSQRWLQTKMYTTSDTISWRRLLCPLNYMAW